MDCVTVCHHLAFVFVSSYFVVVGQDSEYYLDGPGIETR